METKVPDEDCCTLLEAVPAALLVFNASGGIVWANTQALALLGYAAGELTGKELQMLLPPRLRPPFLEALTRYFGQPARMDFSYGQGVYALHREGREFPVEISLSPLPRDDGMLAMACVTDVSGYRQLEAELLQVSQAAEKFSMAACHDLKAPLRVIRNAAGWLSEDLGGQLDSDSKENLALIIQRIRRMEQYIEDLLEYVQIGKGSDNRYRELVTAQELLDDVIIMLEPPSEFSVEVRGDQEGIIVYRMPLQQILFCLLGNAVKHHDKPRGRIVIDVWEEADDDCFSVRDDGPGIDPAFHAQIFEPFQRLKSADRVEGSGLGLAMVSRLSELGGGVVSLDSKPGQGSTFTVKWPKPQAAPAPVIQG